MEKHSWLATSLWLLTLTNTNKHAPPLRIILPCTHTPLREMSPSKTAVIPPLFTVRFELTVFGHRPVPCASCSTLRFNYFPLALLKHLFPALIIHARAHSSSSVCLNWKASAVDCMQSHYCNTRRHQSFYQLDGAARPNKQARKN